MAETEYFETLEEVAAFLNLPLDVLCKMRNAGRFPVAPRAKDSTQVYHRIDLEKWVKGGKPFGANWSKGL